MTVTQQQARDNARVATIIDTIQGRYIIDPGQLLEAVSQTTYWQLQKYIAAGGPSNTAGFLWTWYVDRRREQT